MSFKGKDSFGTFGDKEVFKLKEITPITTEFSKGGVPGSITTINRESAWSRWRRGYELATATTDKDGYQYRFKYAIPATTSSGNPAPTISGSFVGFPTSNKDLGMHWAIWRYAGSVRCDDYTDPVSTLKLYIASVTEDANYWYVQLAGTWSSINPLPAPFYIPVTGQPNGLNPANTEIFEDRIITDGGPIITKDTINPNNQKRFGYVQAVVININPFTGVLTFKKAGSIQVTPDGAFVTPSPIGFTPGRFLITGSRYACTCQDFTHRDYFFASTDGKTNKKLFPRNRLSSVKPGRFEFITTDGNLDNEAMTSNAVDRTVEVYAPSGFQLNYTVTDDAFVDRTSARDNPGVYTEFGSVYTRSTTNIAAPGATSEGMPKFNDYSTSRTQLDSSSVPQDVILNFTDNWTPLLDELRYCKHIYALKFKDHLFPPEPNDFPVGDQSMADWEQRLVSETEKEQQKANAYNRTRRSLSTMDVPPYNCQSPMIFPMLQKLFNITTADIKITNFTMLDKNGIQYTP